MGMPTHGYLLYERETVSSAKSCATSTDDQTKSGSVSAMEQRRSDSYLPRARCRLR